MAMKKYKYKVTFSKAPEIETSLEEASKQGFRLLKAVNMKNAQHEECVGLFFEKEVYACR